MCWDNFIGVDSVCTPISESGYNFIDLGISRSELDSYIGDEFESGIELAQNKVSFAAKSVQNILNTHFGGKFKTGSLLNNTRVGVYQDNLIQDAAVTGSLTGIQLELCNTTSYLNLNLTALTLLVDNTGDVDVFVYDLVQDKLLDTITVSAVAGEKVRVTLNKNYAGLKQRLNLFVGYDSSFASYRSTVYTNGCAGCGGSSWRFSSQYVRNQGGTILNAAQKLDQNVTSSNNTGGLSVEYNVACDFSNWLCSVKYSAALPILYLSAKMIMDYALQQKQWNSNTSIRRQDVEKRRDEYNMEYEKHMAGVLATMSPPKDIVCFRCDQPVKTTLKLP